MTAALLGSHGLIMTDPFAIAQQWHVLHTRSRQEKAVAGHLDARGVHHFLPTVNQVRFHGKRKVTAELPLFPGYVFLWGSREDAFSADRNGRLVSIVAVPDQQRLDWELANLKKALDAAVPLDPFPYLKVGLRAEVRSGPMQGLQGLIESRSRMGRLILQVDMLGRALSVEIDASLLEVID